MLTDSLLNQSLKEKQDELRISLRDLSIRLGVSPAYLTIFFQNKQKAGYLLLHGILCAFPDEKKWGPMILDYLRQNGKKNDYSR